MTPAPDLTQTLQTASAKATPKPSAARGDVAGARKTAEDFAAFFFSQSLESVFSNMGSDKMFGGGSGEEVYKSLLTQEYGKVMARSAGAGLTETVQREILRLQEMA
jgi:Rod binding domain-containing protein